MAIEEPTWTSTTTDARLPAVRFAILIVVAAGVTATAMNLCLADDAKATGLRLPHFERDVRPLLIAHCYECHGAGERTSGIDLRSVSLMTTPRDREPPVVVPGSPEKSRLYRVVEDGSMPPGKPLSTADRRVLREWIAARCPADAPWAVYGSRFFQVWGVVLSVSTILTLFAVGILWRGALSPGQIVVVLAGLPVLGLEASTWAWYPPDALGIGVVIFMGIGLAVGGSLIATANGRSPAAGAGWGLLAPAGLIVLARPARRDTAPTGVKGDRPIDDIEP
ncbi:MAG: c-type cytochrome domain-containing protein [Planctomycetaceae bacterium]